MRCSAVFACVRLLAETVAQLPLVLYQRDGDDRSRASGHALYHLLHEQPNPETTAYTFWETVMAHLALRGNSYAYIERDRLSRVVAIWQLEPDRMTVKRDSVTTQLIYTYWRTDGQTETVRPENVLHLRGLSSNGIVGYSVLEIARESVGLAIGAEQYGGRFFADDGTPGVMLKVPGKLDEDAVKRLRDAWDREVRGGHKTAVLQNGLDVARLSITPEDGQFLETRMFQVADIARIFRIPPHMIGELSRSTYSNISEQSREFVKYTLQPWLTRICQQCGMTLLSPAERRVLYFEHVVEALLRGALKERYDAYSVALGWGFMNANEVRVGENRPPLPGDQGTQYLVPVNMVPRDKIGQEPPREPEPETEPIPADNPAPTDEDEADEV